MSIPEASFDRDGYPTLKALAALAGIKDAADALDFAERLWHHDYGTVRENLTPTEAAMLSADPEAGRYCIFVTGGWSGNESVIAALRKNKHFLWAFTWQLSTRSGLHIFQLWLPLTFAETEAAEIQTGRPA